MDAIVPIRLEQKDIKWLDERATKDIQILQGKT
jgi:hypothetical protein